MPDKRTAMEKRMWDLLGPPLYYCSECLQDVDVIAGDEVKINRPCECNAEIIAPRKAIAAGEGGLNWKDQIKLNWWQLASKVTGRCV